MPKRKWDAFICHASEDKKEFVQPLAEELRRFGLEVWYDEFVVRVGQSLRRMVEEGLSKSRFGIVVLSPDFFLKDWTREELDGLFTLHLAEPNRILPVWHKVTKADVVAYSPILAGRFALKSADGIKAVARGLVEVIKPKALKLTHTQRRVQDAGARLTEQVSEIDPRLDAQVTISPVIKPSLDDLATASKPGLVASIVQDGMRIDLIAREPAKYNADPLSFHVTLKREAMDKISAVQKKGQSITLTDEVLDISVDFISKLFPGATSGGQLVITPVAGKKLNLRVTFRAAEEIVVYDRIEFTIERPGTEEGEMVSTAPRLPFKTRFVIRFRDRSCSVKINTDYFGHEIRDIIKADLAVSILAAGAKIDLFDLDSGRNIGTIEQGQSRINDDRQALSSFIQNAYDVAEAFAQPLCWKTRLDENEYFRAMCLAEIVRKGSVQLPIKSLRLTLPRQEVKTLETYISQNRAVGFQRSSFTEADNIFGTHFDVGPHFVHFVPKEVKLLQESASATGIDVEVQTEGYVVFTFARFSRSGVSQTPSQSQADSASKKRSGST